MKLKQRKVLFIIPIFLISFIFGPNLKQGITTPAFYLATDKSFGSDEIPYVNLEGMGNRKYELYGIA